MSRPLPFLILSLLVASAVVAGLSWAFLKVERRRDYEWFARKYAEGQEVGR